MTHLNCFSLHMNWIRLSSSGSLHFKSTMEQSTTSGFRNKSLASLYSQFSGAGCFCMKAHKKQRIRKNYSLVINYVNFLVVAAINLHLGQCFQGSPQWSHAA